MKKQVVSHGIAFIRTGDCQQCGACCGDCPHHYKNGRGYGCDIHNERHLVCGLCSELEGEEISHARCVEYPDNPWIHVVREGKCAYTFKREDGRAMDDLPFLYGDPYLKQNGNHIRKR